MNDFLSQKLILDLYVIRFYPYIKFDFKEYKKKKKYYNKENTQWNYLLKTTKFGRRFYLF